jgi:signal transduction histidine kinase
MGGAAYRNSSPAGRVPRWRWKSGRGGGGPAGGAEVGQLLEVDITFLVRYDQDDAIMIVGTWSSTGEETAIPVGGRFELGGRSVTTLTEARLAGFTELVGTALANTQAQAALTAFRARIVAAADTARPRIERDLHDGAQQRLVSLALQLRGSTQTSPRPDADALATQMDLVAEEITGVLDEALAKQLFSAGSHLTGGCTTVRSDK